MPNVFYLLMCFCLYLMCVMYMSFCAHLCVCVCTRMCACVCLHGCGGLRLMLGIFLNGSLCYYLIKDFSFNLLIQLSWQWATGVCLSLPLNPGLILKLMLCHAITGVLEVWIQDWYLCDRDFISWYISLMPSLMCLKQNMLLWYVREC